MHASDNPVFDVEFIKNNKSHDSWSETADAILRLVNDQPFCVLATQGQGQPYTSLIAFAYTEDLKRLYFCTPEASRKFRLLKACNRASLLIDSRCQHPEHIMEVEALTITGRTRHLTQDDECETVATMLNERHPYLHAFVHEESTAIFRFEVIRYFHVSRFQEVRQFIP